MVTMGFVFFIETLKFTAILPTIQVDCYHRKMYNHHMELELKNKDLQVPRVHHYSNKIYSPCLQALRQVDQKVVHKNFQYHIGWDMEVKAHLKTNPHN